MSKLIKLGAVVTGLSLLLSGCSVYKAASNEGVSVGDIKSCHVKGCLLAKGMELVSSKEIQNGEYLEIYRGIARKSGFNYVRAAGHGALDVFTLGLWEVAGTPIEGAISNNPGYIIANATFSNKASDQISKLEIFDADGDKVQ